jgi:hypothetical protein
MSEWCGYTTTIGFYDSPVLLGATRIEQERSDTMPIEGLTDIDRPPRQGMLRLGIKKKTASGKEYPSEVDYFILDPETPNEADKKKIIEKFHEVFGVNPKVIEVKLLYSDINKAFPQNYKRWGKNTPLKCIGNGKTAVITAEDWGKGLEQVGVDENGYTIVKCEGRKCIYATTNEDANNKECKATATLSVRIHQLGGLGVWQLTTGSFYSIINVNASIRDLVETYGRAHDIPLRLERRPQETSHKGKKAIHYTLHINETANTAEVAMALQNSTDINTTETPPEILDADNEAIEEAEIDRLADIDSGQTERPLTVNHPPVDMENMPLKATQETTKEVGETINKAVEMFDAKPADAESKEFLDGLKKDSKEELGAEGGKAIKSRAIDKAKKGLLPESFPKFMAFCLAKLEKAGLGAMYRDAFLLHNIKNPKELAKDIKKQADMRRYLESLLEEKGLL